MTRIQNKNVKIFFYGSERETCLGLKIPGEAREIEVGAMDITFDAAGDITYTNLASLKDVSGEFTGYFEKDGCTHGADTPSPSGS
jgi:hypothetical protein